MHPFLFAASQPDAPAIVMGGDGRIVTYRQLTERAQQIQRVFRSRGLGRGDGIAVFSENTADFLAINWAAQSSGMYYTCVNSHLTAPEVAYIVNDCGAKLLVTTERLAAVARDLTPAVIPGVRIRLMTGAPIESWEPFEEALEQHPPAPLEDACEGDTFLYSSGSTGRPKGIKRELKMLELGSQLDPGSAALQRLGVGPGDRVLIPAPLYHAAPLSYAMGANRLGACVVVMEKFDAERALALIEEHRITVAQMVPTMFIRMLKLPEEVRRQYDLSILERVIHGAAPCPPDVKRAIIEWFGPIVEEYYAASEAMGATYITSAEWLEHPGSVGRPIFGTIHILDEGGVELPPGEDGTIWFEGDAAFQYHGDAEETSKTRNDRGWVSVGDIGHVDSDGYLYLSDRKAFMIISGGVNIYPQEIENVLVGHPKVQDVAVIGVPNSEFGEEVKAVVQPLQWADATEDLAVELMSLCRDRLAGYKCPRSVDFATELPRLDTGKLFKHALRQQYWTIPAPNAATVPNNLLPS